MDEVELCDARAKGVLGWAESCGRFELQSPTAWPHFSTKSDGTSDDLSLAFVTSPGLPPPSDQVDQGSCLATAGKAPTRKVGGTYWVTWRLGIFAYSSMLVALPQAFQELNSSQDTSMQHYACLNVFFFLMEKGRDRVLKGSHPDSHWNI